MTSQLERLARPFPPKYVRAPAKGKYGEYVPHHVVTQALLAILGPFELSVGDVFKGEDGKIEGCLVTLSVEIDGRFISVTEVGDCEVPTNWKTQGARMKDAISDGVKRCAARLGCGLHLWAGSDYFLYEQLQNAEGDRAGHRADGSSADAAREPTAAPSATSPRESNESARAANGPESSSPPEGTPGQTSGKAVTKTPSKHRRDKLKSRCVALTADGVSIADAREELKLPLVDSCDDEQLKRFEAMVDDLTASLEAPFAEAKS